MSHRRNTTHSERAAAEPIIGVGAVVAGAGLPGPTVAAKPPPKTVQFAPAALEVTEGDTATVTVTRTNPRGAARIVVAGGPGPKHATGFRPGQTSVSFTVPTVEDTVAEADETFVFTLVLPRGTKLGVPSTATLTIHDDGDLDGDGFDAAAEAAARTDPLDHDTDDDYLNDGDEVVLGTNPKNPDTDYDHLPDGDEWQLGTDPLEADTDGHRCTDGYEVSIFADPLDPSWRCPVGFRIDRDNDGLSRGDELFLGTDPNAADHDGDGLGDGDELFQHGTDPLDADSDHDTFSDGEEVNERGTDPLDAASPDITGDLDGDGLDAAAEAAAGTNPRDADTDHHALGDAYEITVSHTSPIDADTDDDGLSDSYEVTHTLTDPRDATPTATASPTASN